MSNATKHSTGNNTGKDGSGSEKITPDDLLNKLQSFQDGVQQNVANRKQTLIAVGGGIGVFMLILFFLLGRRAGRKKTTLVEIKRF